jgi:hypothetical protein
MSDADTHNRRGNALADAGRHGEAIEAYSAAVAADPMFGPAHSNLGNSLRVLGRFKESESACRRAIELAPSMPQAHVNLANTLLDLLRLDEAEASFTAALKLAPESAHAHLGYAFLKLLQGDYAEGWPHYEYRFAGGGDQAAGESRVVLERLSSIPRWQGEDLEGRTLLVWTEQGLGDSLMMLRYLPLLESRGAGRLIVFCRPDLVRLIAVMPSVDRAVGFDRDITNEQLHLHCPLMSLPLLFGTRLDSIPSAVPYLATPPVRHRPGRRRRVGLVWAGNASLPADARRSLRFEALAPLLAVPGIEFVSLQYGTVPKPLTGGIEKCADVMDTAMLVSQLDLVIAVDTAMAHLAGALGKPVWLLNRYESEWRWLLEREDSRWYPSMRIFRQGLPGDWAPVVERVAQCLRETTPAKAGWFR